MRTLLAGILAGAIIGLPGVVNALTLYAFDDLQLAVAISQASDGDTIKIGPGNYGYILIRGDSFNQVNVGGYTIMGGAPSLTSNVKIESLDPTNRASIRNIDVRVSNHWTFSGIDVRPPHSGPSFTAVKFAGDGNRLENSIISYGDHAGWTAADWNNNAGRGAYVSGDGNTFFNNYLYSVSGGFTFDHGATNSQAIHNTVNGVAGDAVKALGDHTLLENNLFKNFKNVNSNHDDCVQSFSKQNGVIGAGAVVGLTIRGNLCIASEDQADPFYSGTQGYALFNGTAKDWTVENNILVSSTYHGIFLAAAENAMISNNTILDDNGGINGANTVWIRNNGSGPGNEVIDNIANTIVPNSNNFHQNNAEIDIIDYDDWFINWMEYDFRLRPDAPIPGIGAIPTNAGAFFDPYAAVPLPASAAMLIGGMGVFGGLRMARRRLAAS